MVGAYMVVDWSDFFKLERSADYLNGRIYLAGLKWNWPAARSWSGHDVRAPNQARTIRNAHIDRYV